MQHRNLTVLSFGAGQDSTAILYKIIYDQAFRAIYVQGDLIVIFSDTGDEHPGTYRHLKFIKRLCFENRIPFYHLTPDLGFHPKRWQSLRTYMEHYRNIMADGFNKSCTDNLKIRPIYTFLNEWVANTYFMKHPRYKKLLKRKQALYEFTKQTGNKITMLIGIAYGEEKRVAKVNTKDAWMCKNINRIYPLISEKMDRQGCQDYIRSVGHEVPPPSNCMLCPFLSDIELLWLFRFHPEDFYYWVEREADKIANFAAKGYTPDKNRGVGRDGLLMERLERIEAEYGHMSDEDLQEYKMSHGHCVKSTY